jgi:tetratricopeptide (TPR) repeat protein
MAVLILGLACGQACAAHRGATTPRVPVAKAMGSTVEQHDRALSAALLALRLSPSSERHRAVANEYRRLRIDDAAFDHLTAATRLDPQDAAAYDQRARIWRDWGAPQWGLADASRAVFHAPTSPAAHNTRGTLLAAVGQIEAARRDFRAALTLDSGAAFAAANLCHLDALEQGVPVGGPCQLLGAPDLPKAASK